MKKLILVLAFPLIFACENDKDSAINPNSEMIQGEDSGEFPCVNAQADTLPTLDSAKALIVGKWQLKGMIARMANPEIPNYQIEFLADGGVTVTLAGKKVFSDAYSVIEETSNGYRNLKLITDSLMDLENQHNIVKGNIRICEKELMLDQGIAFDAPGYLFRKVK